MKGLEVSIQEILSSMQVRKIKSTNDINCLRCSYNSFLPILNHLSLLAKFHLSSQKLFTRYYIRFEANHKQPAWECVPPRTFCILHKSCICVCGFLFFFLHVIYISKKEEKMYCVHVCTFTEVAWLHKQENMTCSVHRSIQIFAFNDLKSNYSKVLCESWSTTRVN